MAIRGILNQPPLLVDADAPVIPEITDILIAYATWQALKSDGDVLATQYRDEYFYRLERFKEYTLRSTTQEGRIRDRFFEKYALRARKEVAE
ncbi:MAG: hypothetical protein DDT40_01341 [candidate division WS2 bacterium]|nr:hypothetical protein [Candidatus Psychracetigena formicireducens]